MKKIFIVISFALITSSISAQSGGTGTSSDPYWGDISVATIWSSGTYSGNMVYVGTVANPDLRIISNGHLTIDPGITVIFKQLLSDLIITGTGQITAGGAGSAVTFTKESNNYWGHISFESMGSAPASVFNNCIIEYGDVSSFPLSDPHAGGGGMFIDFNNVSISNCTFRHNKSQWGGGIFVYTSRNPGIKNCYFYNNSAREAGGGIFLYYYATSLVENSIFYNNLASGTSSSDYNGGGLAAFSSNAKIVNCTFVNNISSRPNGQGLELYGASGSSVINSVLWGSASQLYLGAGTAGNTIVNCAIQSAVPSGSVNSFVLNSNNSSPDGPNFNATDGSDWSVKFISPTRDAGVSSYAGVTIPSTDYINNPNLFTKDIGAYEVQYSRWAGGGTAWGTASNWLQNLIPASSSDIIIPSGLTSYPTDVPGPAVTIGTGKYLILEPGAKATISNISNSGTLWLMSNTTDIFSLIVDNYSNNGGAGTEKIELYLSGKETGTVNNWHFISSPVSSLPASTFAPVPTQNLAQFMESLPTPDNEGLVEGWIAYDGYSYTTGEVNPNPPYAFGNLNTGQGYNYFHTLNHKYTISGNLNTANVTRTIEYTGAANSPLHGINLLGNPFSSGLNWDYITSGPFPQYTSKAIHFTSNNVQCDYVNGVGTFGATGIIPPMQGFFLKANDIPDIQLTIPAAARVNNNIHGRYKGENIIPLIRLSITENLVTDETVVRFDELAKSDLDYDFDAVKLFITSPSVYTFLSGTNYAINGLPFPKDPIEIPVIIKLATSGTHTISSTQLQGLDNYSVTLTDKITGFSANLITTPEIVFSADPGTIPDRFVLKIGLITTGSEDLTSSENIFNIYHFNNAVNIKTISDDWDGKTGSIRILDLAGKVLTNQQNNDFRKNSVIQIQSEAANGLYIVEIRSGLKRYVGKVMIK